MSDEALLQKYLPEITFVTSAEGARIAAEGGEIFSHDGKRVGLDGFMLVLADDIGPSPVRFDERCLSRSGSSAGRRRLWRGE